MKFSEFIYSNLSNLIYAFSLDEARTAVDGSDVAVRRQLDRAIEQGDIFSLRRGFYLILPPLYKSIGKLPLRFYVDKLFSTLDRRYYVSTLSASALHGAAHQQIQSSFITTDKSLRNISKGSYRLEFITATNWPTGNIVVRRGEAGEYYLSDPALTIADLLHHQVQLGGLNRIIANVEELSEELTMVQLQELLEWYPYNSTLQRMGYLLQVVGAEDALINCMKAHLAEKKTQTIPLFPDPRRKAGEVALPWQVRLNVEIQSDLW